MESRKRVLLTQPEDDSSECGSTPTRDKPISELEGSSRGHSAVRVNSGTSRSEFSHGSIYSDARSPDTMGRASATSDYFLNSTRENSIRRRNESLSQEVLEEEDEQEEEEEELAGGGGRGEEDNVSDDWGASESDSADEDGAARELRDSDYDTDLELNDDKWLYPERYDRDTTGLARYLKACRDLGLQPVRYFIKHMQDDSLKLKHHGLGPEAMKALAAPLEINTTIEHMDLEGNWIMAEGTAHLCRVLKDNVFLTGLNLSENRIENEGAFTVCQLLISNRTIERLDLAGNGIGDQTGEIFYTLLKQKTTALRHLNLRHNKLEDGAAQWFRDALVENETLENLDLSWNHFQCKGCVLLAEGLKENVGLKKLSVAMNGFGLAGGKELGKAISANRTLQRLDASYCRLPVESAPYLALGLECNDVLHSLDLSYNALNADAAYAMVAQLEKNDSSGLKLLNFGNTKVYDKFEELQEKLRLERGLQVMHGGVLEEHRKEVVEVDPLEAFKQDPMTKLKEWVAKAGYRLIDLLRHFDKDQSMSISIEEFRQGIASTSIEITEEQLQILVSRLDQDGDGEIDFSELMEGDKTHRRTKREIDKYLMEKEEMAKNSVDETEREFSSQSSNS